MSLSVGMSSSRLVSNWRTIQAESLLRREESGKLRQKETSSTEQCIDPCAAEGGLTRPIVLSAPLALTQVPQ